MADRDMLTFRCDDRNGGEIRILRAVDHDFHIMVMPVKDDIDEDDWERHAAQPWLSVRVRMPMMGGGSHPELWHALASVFNDKVDGRVSEITSEHVEALAVAVENTEDEYDQDLLRAIYNKIRFSYDKL
jgi:hypothetical protein